MIGQGYRFCGLYPVSRRTSSRVTPQMDNFLYDFVWKLYPFDRCYRRGLVLFDRKDWNFYDLQINSVFNEKRKKYNKNTINSKIWKFLNQKLQIGQNFYVAIFGKVDPLILLEVYKKLKLLYSRQLTNLHFFLFFKD